MELTGEHRIPAPRQKVWEALHDPEILKSCITGCEQLDMADDGTMKAKVTAKVGPVKATFDADVEIVNSNPPESYTLQGQGKGGVAGFAKGSADVSLAEDGDGTILTYAAKANVGGKLAQLGSRLVDSTAKRYAADFFTCFSEKVDGTGTTAAEPVAAEPVTTEPVAAEPAPPEPLTSVPPVAETAPAAAPIPPVAPQPMPTEMAQTPTPPPSAVPPKAAASGSRLWIWLLIAVVVLAVVYALAD